jgi:hypothetical protein
MRSRYPCKRVGMRGEGAGGGRGGERREETHFDRLIVKKANANDDVLASRPGMAKWSVYLLQSLCTKGGVRVWCRRRVDHSMLPILVWYFT